MPLRSSPFFDLKHKASCLFFTHPSIFRLSLHFQTSVFSKCSVIAPRALLDREKDTIDVCYHKILMAAVANRADAVAKNTFIDISQNSDRLPFSHNAPCLTGSAHLLSLDKKAVISKASHMLVHGWLEEYVAGTSESDAASLGGDAWCLPVMGLVAMAYWMCPMADWWSDRPRNPPPPRSRCS